MNPRRPRIAITPEALRILRILAAVENMEPSDYLSSLVLQEGTRSLGDFRLPREPEEPRPPRSPPEAQNQAESQPGGQLSRSAQKAQINQVPGLPERILELTAQGKGTTEIGRLVGRSPTTISTWLKRQREKDMKDKI